MSLAALWMRHGTCGDGLYRPGAHARPDSSLTIVGAVETMRTVRELHKRRCHPTLVVSSPLRRARQTAAVVACTSGTQLGEPIRADAAGAAPRSDENLFWVWQSSGSLGACVPVNQIDARGLPGTTTCCFVHDLQLR